MKTLTFRGGIHPKYNKDISIREPLREAPLPSIAVIPLSQHIGAPNQAIVAKGDEVVEGQTIGTSESFVSSPVHSPISGKVTAIKKVFHPVLGPTEAVLIERDKDKEPLKYTERDVDNFTREELLVKIKDAGLVGMGGASFPTHVKLNVPKGKKIDDLVINGAECEPYLTCDHVLMTRKTQEILMGIELVIRILQPKRTYIAIEDNKKAALFAFEKAVKKSTHKAISGIRLAALKTKYPQGGEKQLIKSISNLEVPPGKLPLDLGFMVQNVGTIHAIYEAIYLNKPLIERIVTLTGDCINRPGNYLIRVGSTIKDIMDQYGIEFYRDPKKIISGGPMMGFSQPSMDFPILKSTSGILFLSEKSARSFEQKQCIRCAKCIDVCPVNLLPTTIMKNVEKQNWDRMEMLCVSDCMECGACSYICPARIPLVQYIKEGKSVFAKMSRI